MPDTVPWYEAPEQGAAARDRASISDRDVGEGDHLRDASALAGSRMLHFQNPYLSPTCICLGSPSPFRIVPSKLNNNDAEDGSRKLSRFRTLNTSTSASTCPRFDVLNGRDSRMSQLAYALSRRIVLRSRILPFGQMRSVGAVAR